MARKFCPSCKRLNGGTATVCPQCGHVFDVSTMVETVRAVAKPSKVCLVCGAHNPLDAQICDCREPLDTNADHARMLLRSRRTNGAIMAVVGLVGLVGLLAAVFVTGWYWRWPFGVAGLGLVYGARVVRSSNRLLAALPAPLPTATLRDPSDKR